MFIINSSMLFKNLYNWIKYKTLPPSVLFKNRLFIERDARNKRILNNLGWVFRSSKWGTRQLPNILLMSKISYLRGFIYFLVIIATFYLFFYAYLNFYFLYFIKFITFGFWVTLDMISYFCLFFIWFSWILVNSLLKFSYVFFWHNTNTVKLAKTHNTEFSKLHINSIFLNEKYLIYFWLNNNKLMQSSALLEKLFNQSYLYASNETKLNLFTNLFTSVYSLNLLNLNYYKLWIQPLTIVSINKNYTSLFFDFNLAKNTTLFKKKINSIRTTSISHNFSSNLLFNAFNTYSLNIKELSCLTSNYSELQLFNQIILNNVQSFKWYRWLYKYSTLHRSVFQFNKYIQLPLNEVNFHNFNVQNLSNNSWFRQLTSISSNNNFNLPTYQPINKSQLLPTTFMPDQINQLSLLTTLPSSFNWITKRLFLVNKMAAQKINLLPNYLKRNTQPIAKTMLVNLKLTSYENLFNNQTAWLSYATAALTTQHHQFVIDGLTREWFTLNNLYFNLNATKIINNFSFSQNNNFSTMPCFSFMKQNSNRFVNFFSFFNLIDLTLSTNNYNADFFYFTKL